jgi:hypothetical protein
VLYALISVVVVLLAIRHAQNSGRSATRWGWGVALVMYLIPFWDWLPTVAMHQYHCATEAGFRVYKTPEQWMKENPRVMDTLVARRITVPDRTKRLDEDNWTSIFALNERFEKRFEHRGPLFLHLWRTEAALADGASGEVLVRSVDFYTAQTRAGGGWRGWKFWLAIDHCPTHEEDSKNFGAYLGKINGASK